MRAIAFISRILISIVFIFSGFVKAIDPLGSTYKFSDYFEAWGMDFMAPIALVLAILLSGAELLIGLALLLGLKMKTTSWSLFLFMSFFLVFTLIIAITNPVTDCGCFGDAIIITNWQTFWKNVIFFVPTLIIFFNRNRFSKYYTPGFESLLVLGLACITVLINVYCLRNLPLIDFRPYKIGTNISAAMEIPEGKPKDVFLTTLIYEKEGVQKEFALDSIPYQDSTWKWVESKHTLIKKGYVPPIHDFSLTSEGGDDITYEILSDPDYSLLIVAYKLEKANPEGLKKVFNFAQLAKEKGVSVYGMTASTWDVSGDVLANYSNSVEFYTADDITQKTMIRSNPGVLLLKNGYVIAKWHYRNLPEVDRIFMSDMQTFVLHEFGKNRNVWLARTFILLSLLMFVLVMFTRKK